MQITGFARFTRFVEAIGCAANPPRPSPSPSPQKDGEDGRGALLRERPNPTK